MDPVLPSSAAAALRPAAEASPARVVEAFGERLGSALAEANQAQHAAEAAGQGLATGEVDIVETMVALGKADLSLRFVVALRNRALEAYTEIMRLQV